MKYGYARINNIKELLEFRHAANSDKEFYDLANLNDAQRESNVEFEKLLETVKVGDTIILKSLDNGCRVDSVNNRINDLISLLTVCTEAGAKLCSLEDKSISKLLSSEGISILSMIREFSTKTERNIRTKKYRTLNYPQNFLEVYRQYRMGLINHHKAAEKLEVSVGTFYKKVFLFESE